MVWTILYGMVWQHWLPQRKDQSRNIQSAGFRFRSHHTQNISAFSMCSTQFISHYNISIKLHKTYQSMHQSIQSLKKRNTSRVHHSLKSCLNHFCQRKWSSCEDRSFYSRPTFLVFLPSSIIVSHWIFHSHLDDISFLLHTGNELNGQWLKFSPISDYKLARSYRNGISRQETWMTKQWKELETLFTILWRNPEES